MKFNPILVPVSSLISAGIALTLSFIAVIGTGDKDSLHQFSTVQFNSSTILQHAVKVRSSTSLNQRALPTSFISKPPVVNAHLVFRGNPIEDGINEASALLNSAVAPIATAVGTGIIPSPTNIISEFENVFNEVLGKFSLLVGKGVDSGVDLLIKEVVKILGIKPWYGLYFGQFCSADYTPNYQDPNATLTGMKCRGVRDPQKSQSQNTIQLGTTTLDFSALNLPEKVTSISNQLTTGFRFMFGLEILGMITAGLLILILPFLFINRLRLPIALIGASSIASISALCFFLVALIQTAVAITAGGIANQLGYGLGLSAHRGGPQLVLLWASTVLMIFAASILFAQWFDKIYIRRSLVHVYHKPMAEPISNPKWEMDR